ncbi:MAG: energy transducer TonB [Chitinophagaceae bacterium]
MKRLLSILLVLIAITSSAQKLEKFYDFRWHPCDSYRARYYALLEFKDGLWARSDYFIHEKKLQMQGNYHDSTCKIPEGIFYYFHPNGTLSSTGKFVNGKKEELWLSYHSNGMMSDSTFYTNGKPSGISQSWNSNGYQTDSALYMADGKSVSVSWFDNGTLSSAGYKINDAMQGKWRFYHSNGNISAEEVYDHGKLLSRKYFNESGEEIADTTNHDRHASFAAGEKAWAKYVLKNLYFPAGVKITGGDRAFVVVEATVDEEGNIINPEITSPFYPDFNKIALQVMKNAPKWLPAIDHNRKVRSTVQQPVTFAQESN